MPGIGDWEQLFKTHGLPIGVLLLACGVLLVAVRTLYAENRRMHERLEQLLDERSKTLDAVLHEFLGARNR